MVATLFSWLTPEAMAGEAMFTSLIATGVGLWLVVGAAALATGGHPSPDQGQAAPTAMAA